MLRNPWVFAGSFEDRLRSANLAISALAESLFDDDPVRIRADALRLHDALVIVERSAIARGVGEIEMHAAVASVLHQVQRIALPLLAMPAPEALWQWDMARGSVVAVAAASFWKHRS